jgi:hypothetical protein
MTIAFALLLVLSFLLLLGAFGVLRRAKSVFARTRQALADVRSRELDELQKEQAMQAHAKALFVAFAIVTGASLAALAVPLAIVALAAATGIVDFDQVLAATMTWPILLAATVAGVGLSWVRRR